MSPAVYGSDDPLDPLRAQLGTDRADIDEDQAADLRRQLADAAASAGHLRHQPPPLGPGELRALLRECVNLVEPGDMLILRMPPGELTRAQLDELQTAVNWWLTEYTDGQVRALVVPAAEVTIFRPADPDPVNAAVSAAMDRISEEYRLGLEHLARQGWQASDGEEPTP